jgi:hypothetical protein
MHITESPLVDLSLGVTELDEFTAPLGGLIGGLLSSIISFVGSLLTGLLG